MLCDSQFKPKNPGEINYKTRSQYYSGHTFHTIFEIQWLKSVIK